MFGDNKSYFTHRSTCNASAYEGSHQRKQNTHVFDGTLHEFTCFKCHPDPQYREIALSRVLNESSTAILGTQLSQNRQCTNLVSIQLEIWSGLLTS